MNPTREAHVFGFPTAPASTKDPSVLPRRRSIHTSSTRSTWDGFLTLTYTRSKICDLWQTDHNYGNSNWKRSRVMTEGTTVAAHSVG